MVITVEKVKQALLEVARKRNRPYFDMITVRDVAEAIINNGEHRLKNATLQELFLVYSHEVESQQKILKKTSSKPSAEQSAEVIRKIKLIKSYYSGQKQLLIGTKVSDRTISGLLTGTRALTPRIYERLHPFIDELINKLQSESKPRKEVVHGVKNTYSKHKCRCEPCKKAWMSYAKERKLLKKLKTEKEKN